MNIQWQNSENVKINNTNTSAIIEDASEVLSYFADKYIITKYPIKTGDLVEYAGITYIVVSQIDRNIENRNEKQYNYRARVSQADFIIKLVVDGKLEIIPSIIEGQRFDLLDGQFISLSGDRIIITISDEVKIDKGMRFIKLGQAWKVVGIDKTKLGLGVLICDSDIINPNTDDLANEIADKNLLDEIPVEPEEPDDPPVEDNLTITITGNDTINVIQNGKYTAKVYNNDVEVLDKQVRFTVSDTTLATIKSQGNNQCELVANPNFKLGEVILKAILVDDETVFGQKLVVVAGM